MAYHPDDVPASPSAYDDEFSAATVDEVKWTIDCAWDETFEPWQTDGDQHLSQKIVPGKLLMQGDWWYSDGGVYKPYFYQLFEDPISLSTPFCVVAKLSGGGGGDGPTHGMSSLSLWGQDWTYGVRLEVQANNNKVLRSIKRLGGAESQLRTYAGMPRYLQIVNEGAGDRVHFLVSQDGFGWGGLDWAVSVTGLTEFMGISLENHGDSLAAWDFVRVFMDDGVTNLN